MLAPSGFSSQLIPSFVYDAGRDRLIVALTGRPAFPAGPAIPPSIKVLGPSGAGTYTSVITTIENVAVNSLARDEAGDKIYGTVSNLSPPFGQGLVTIDPATYAVSAPAPADPAIGFPGFATADYANGRFWSVSLGTLDFSGSGAGDRKLAEVSLATGQVVSSASIEANFSDRGPLWDPLYGRLYTVEKDPFDPSSTTELRWYTDQSCSLDSAHPTVSLISPASGSTWFVNQPIPIDVDCSDAGGSGLRRCFASVTGLHDDGDTFVAASPGEYFVAAYATDWAGNTTFTGHFITIVANPDSDGDGVPDSLDVEVASPPDSVGFSDAVSPDARLSGSGPSA